MLTIRLMRFGRKHQPFFRLVVVPKRGKPARSKYVELLGWVNPLKHERKIDAERVQYWVSQGAQPSPTAWNLFIAEGILSGVKKRKKGKVVVAEKTASEETETLQAAAPSETKAVEETAQEASGEEASPALQESTAAPARASAGEVDNKE
ncbi:MAG: 30S ribosomal protein S16 [Candidatus Terrybacteria bacterium]|nr:30S ribosomal protein S16 [Candidatus Terrybacteria bacterium]